MTDQAIGLPMWTIYDHPSDYPDSYVAKLWIITAGKRTDGGSTFTSSDLGLIRRFLEFQMHLTCLPRLPEDDPVIIETWF